MSLLVLCHSSTYSQIGEQLGYSYFPSIPARKCPSKLYHVPAKEQPSCPQLGLLPGPLGGVGASRHKKCWCGHGALRGRLYEARTEAQGLRRRQPPVSGLVSSFFPWPEHRSRPAWTGQFCVPSHWHPRRQNTFTNPAPLPKYTKAWGWTGALSCN